MKTLLLSFILSVCSLATVAQAIPDSTIQSKQSALANQNELVSLNPPYKVAVGVRLLNVAGDYDLGVNTKYFISSHGALEASLSKVVFNDHAYQLALMYERHNKLFKSDNVLLYYGAGAGLLHVTKEGYGNYYSETPNATTQFGLGYIAGVEVGLGKFPLAISADFRGLYYLKPSKQGGLPNVANAALGIKYRFGMLRK